MANAYDISQLCDTIICYASYIKERLPALTNVEALEFARTLMHVQQLGGKTPQAGAWMTGQQIKKALDAYHAAMGTTPTVSVQPPKRLPPPKPDPKRAGVVLGQRSPTAPVRGFGAATSAVETAPAPDDLRPVVTGPEPTDAKVPFPIGDDEEISDEA